MYLLLFVLYVAAEIAVLAWLGSTVGALATVLIFLAGSVVGYLVLAGQGRRALRNLGALRGTAPHGRTDVLSSSPERLLTDGALVGAGAALVLVPGLVTTALGIVLLAPTRAAARPLVRLLVARRAQHLGARQRLVVVDGQVVDHTVIGDGRLHAPRRGPHAAHPGDGEVLEGEIVQTPRRGATGDGAD